MFSLNYTWLNDREAGDLRRNLAHYDVIVMIQYGAVKTRLIFLKIPQKDTPLLTR